MRYQTYTRAQTRKIISRTLAKLIVLSRQAPTPETEAIIRIQAKSTARAARITMDESCRRTRQGVNLAHGFPGYDRQVARHNAIFNIQSLLGELQLQIRTADKRNDQLEVETGWRWDKIQEKLKQETWVWDDESDDFQREIYVGDVLSSTPSGKMYMPWSTNVTEDEASVDEEYHEKMSEEAEERGLWVSWEDGDCFVGESRDLSDLEIGDSFELPDGYRYASDDYATKIEWPEVRGTVAKRTVKSRNEYTKSAIEKLIEER